MNTIATFRKCTLSDEQLIEAVDKITDEMYTTGKIPTRHIPARPDEDYDLLVGELLLRLKDKMTVPRETQEKEDEPRDDQGRTFDQWAEDNFCR